MRVYAHFDSKGVIGGLVVVDGDEDDGAISPPLPRPAPGYNVAELDQAAVKQIESLVREPDRERAAQISERYLVSVRSAEQATLKKRG